MRGLLVAAILLAAPTPAVAETVYVGASTPGASDVGPCLVPEAPCATIQAAVEKSEALGGGDVRVVANSDGRTTDAYAEQVTLDGSAPVSLIGAGDGPNGTSLAPTTGTPLTLATGTAARSLRVTAPSGATAVAGAIGSKLDEARVDAPGGTAYAGAGRVEDSRLVAATGARLDSARLVRTQITATVDGVLAAAGTSQLLEVVVRSRTATGDALRVGGATAGRAELRHVTLGTFPVRVRLDGHSVLATMQAANATFAQSTGTDLRLEGQLAKAKLRTVNRAPARTVLADGARPGNFSDTDPVDLPPALTSDGRLSPSSPLVDRGTREGILARDPDDATDIDGTPRRQGAAPDIGADELAPAAPDGLRWVTVGAFVDPMWVASPPGDLERVFVVERRGVVKVVDGGQILPTAALDISARVMQDQEGGLLSIAFAPDFATSRRVYGLFTLKDDPNTPEDELGDITLVEWTVPAGQPNVIDPSTERQVMLLEHSATHNHYGGTLLFGPDGLLWISLGDSDRQPNPAQDLSKPLGKILRIDPRQAGGQPFTVPPDNPFVGQAGKLGEIWAYGLRNPFRIGFDAVTGDLWIGDVGEHRYDEIDLLLAADGRGPGANFGWRITEGDVIFQTGAPVTPANAPPDYVGPVIVRRQDEGDRSITAGTVVRDPTIASLQGRFLYADFFLGFTRAATAAPGGVTGDGEVEGLPAVVGVDSYSLDGCRRVYATSLFGDTVLRLTTTGQCVPPPEACTITGTNGNDTLVGTTGRDVICGRDGSDRLIGSDGDDVLAGGPGDDELIGGAGADEQQGGDGSDRADYSGRTQPVAVTVGSGADDGEAGEADDVQADVERVRGGSADDRLTAGSGRVRFFGEGGADVLRGSPLEDTLEGGPGADELEGGAGRDTLLGGDDADLIRALDGIRDTLVCGLGVDTTEHDPVDVVDASCE